MTERTAQDEADDLMARLIALFVEVHGREPASYAEVFVWIAKLPPDLILPPRKGTH